jgi:hypothetical protein
MSNQTQKDFEIVQAIGEMPPDTIVTEDGLAKLFCRHPVSIRRSVQRGELPAAIRLMGKPVWTVRAIREHLAGRLDQAKIAREKLEQKINRLGA